MAKSFLQKIVFKNTTTTTLYELYMNAKKHSDATGSLAKITQKEGAVYSAHDGYITGKNLQLIKDKLIVQTWRAQDWNEADIDSIFIMHFEQKGKNTILNITHANLPDQQSANINKGWHEYYWEPWKQYLLENK